MFSEASDMNTAGVVVWTMIVFGGGAALVLLYFLDTRTELSPIVKGASCLVFGIAAGGLAARYRWVRRLSALAVCLVSVLWYLRVFAYV